MELNSNLILQSYRFSCNKRPCHNKHLLKDTAVFPVHASFSHNSFLRYWPLKFCMYKKTVKLQTCIFSKQIMMIETCCKTCSANCEQFKYLQSDFLKCPGCLLQWIRYLFFLCHTKYPHSSFVSFKCVKDWC